MAKDCGCSVAELIADKDKRKNIDIRKYISDNVGMPTLTDIMAELENQDATHVNIWKNLSLILM